MTVTKQFSIESGAIPASCFKVGGKVRAFVRNLGDVESLDLTITVIALEATPGVDLVTFQFEDSHLPKPGADVTACDFISFGCASCGCSQWCREVFGPGEPLSETTRHAGYVDRPIQATYVFIGIADPVDNPVSLQVLVNSLPLFAIPATISGNVARVHLASFHVNYADGLIPADAKVEVVISANGSELLEEGEPGYVDGAGYVSNPAQGLEICFGGELR